MNMELRSSSVKKVDIAFANGLSQAKRSWKLHIFLHLLQYVAMTIMIPLEIKVMNDKQDSILSFFIAASFVSFVNMISKLSHLICQLSNPSNIIAIAKDLNHTIDQYDSQSQRLGQHLVEGITISSNIYNIQTKMNQSETTPQIRKGLQTALTHMIKNIALSRDPIFQCFIKIGSLISFLLFVYGIVVLIMHKSMNTAEMIVIILFIISQFVIQVHIFICIIILALIPILCLFYCFFVCFCKQGQKPAKLPPPIPATVEIIQKTEGSPCSICFQGIMLEQQVIVLPCSQNHVFHDKCILTWTAVKPACPICRHDLSQ